MRHQYASYVLTSDAIQSVLISNRDRHDCFRSSLQAATSNPADVMDLEPSSGRLQIGGKADFIIFRARSCSELFSRPQYDRVSYYLFIFVTLQLRVCYVFLCCNMRNTLCHPQSSRSSPDAPIQE